MNITYKLLTFFVLLLMAGCSTTSVREHPQLESQLEKVDSVVILPPKAIVELIVFSGENERMEDQEILIKEKLMNVATETLTAKGYEIVDFDFSEESIANSDLPFAINQVHEGYASAKALLYEKPMIAEKKKRSILADVGTSINTINESTGADAVFMMDYSGFEKSSGMVAKDIAASVLVGVLTMGSVVPVQAVSSSSLEASLIDTVTGEVLWSNFGLGNHPEHIMASLPVDIDPAAPFTSEELPEGEGEIESQGEPSAHR